MKFSPKSTMWTPGLGVVTFFALTSCLALVGTLPVWTLAVWLAFPRMLAVWKVFGEPRPSEAPDNFPIWATYEVRPVEGYVVYQGDMRFDIDQLRASPPDGAGLRSMRWSR